MYKEDYFYQIIDVLRYDLFKLSYKNQIKSERCILKIFSNRKDIVIIENKNNADYIIDDQRKDKSIDFNTFDLVFLKSIDRYKSDVEIKGKVYEHIDGIGYYTYVKIDGYSPNDKRLKPFFNKKHLKYEELNKYVKNEDDLKYIQTFFRIVKGDNFTPPKMMRNLFEEKCYNIDRGE